MKIDCKITENFLKEEKRMCRSMEDCPDCELAGENTGVGLSCSIFLKEYPSEAIEIVQKWSDAHLQKTYKEDFFEKFPNAEKVNGYSIFTPCCIHKELNVRCKDECNCSNCWDKIMEK